MGDNGRFQRVRGLLLFFLLVVILTGGYVGTLSGSESVVDVSEPAVGQRKAPRRYITSPEVWHGCRDGKCFEARLVHNDATQFLEPGPCPSVNPCSSSEELQVNDDS